MHFEDSALSLRRLRQWRAVAAIWPRDALSGAHHVLEMFRRTLPDGPIRTCLDRLSNRLAKIVTVAKSLGPS
jgi:hypothetical protein